VTQPGKKGPQTVQLSVASSPSHQNWIWDLLHLQIMDQGFPCKGNVATVCSETLVSIQSSGLGCKELHTDITTCLLGMVLMYIQHFTKKSAIIHLHGFNWIRKEPTVRSLYCSTETLDSVQQEIVEYLCNYQTFNKYPASYVQPLLLAKILVFCHRLPLLCSRTLAPRNGGKKTGKFDTLPCERAGSSANICCVIYGHLLESSYSDKTKHQELSSQG